MSDRPTPETKEFMLQIDDSEIDMTLVERKLAWFETQRDEAREETSRAVRQRDEAWDEIAELKRELGEVQKELANAKKEAEMLATSIYRSEYHSIDSEWSLLDSVAGVISQIDNMYAGIRHQRDEAVKARNHNRVCVERLTAERDEAREEIDEAKAILRQVDLPDEPLVVQAKRMVNQHDWQLGINNGQAKQIDAANNKNRELRDLARELRDALEGVDAAFAKFCPDRESRYGYAWTEVQEALTKAKEAGL